MAVSQPDSTSVHFAGDGSVVLRWMSRMPQAKRRRWLRNHPDIGLEDLATGRGPFPHRWSSPTQPEHGDLDEFLGELQVWFAEEDTATHGRPSSMRLTLAEGMTPTTLQRFPWARLLTTADAANRARTEEMTFEEGAKAIGSALEQAWRKTPSQSRAGKKPGRGRPGHPDEYYKAVAEVYTSLRAQGVTNPVAVIAKEAKYNRSTVAGWIKVARQKGYLPPAHPGRAG